MSRLLHAFCMLAFASFATSAISQQQTASVVVTPPVVSLALGQSMQLSAQVKGVPAQSRLTWSLRGPRYAGVDWGRITATGRYTAPLQAPNGQIFITATVFGNFGQPLGSASVPVNLSAATVQPSPGQFRPPVVEPRRPAPSVPPGVIAPPAVAPPPPAIQPPPSVAAAGSPATLIKYISDGKALCQRGQASQGAREWSQAGAIWDGLAQNARLQVVQQLVSGQLGDNSTRVAVDSAVFNYARVTADANGTKMSLSGSLTRPGSRPYYQTLLDVPLIRDPQLDGIGSGKPNRTLVHFLCYETEIARIRTMIQDRCLRFGTSMRGAINAEMGNNKLSQAAYERLMKPWLNAVLADRLAASWMIERIAADPVPDLSSCDLPLSATQLKPTNPNGWDDYRTRIVNVTFMHDMHAATQGARRCVCR